MTLVDKDASAQSGMRARLIEEYGTLVRLHDLRGPVLEITSGPRQNAVSPAPFLAAFERHVLLDGESGEHNGVQFHKGSPNDMSQLFDDACFATVIWDRGLERDAAFWLTVAEIKRVLIPGGALVVCTKGVVKAHKFGVKVVGANGNPINFLTATGSISTAKPDNLRFSPQGLRKVVLAGFDIRELHATFMTPHLFAVAVKPG